MGPVGIWFLSFLISFGKCIFLLVISLLIECKQRSRILNAVFASHIGA
jgi:hypothetical protein